VPAHEVLLSMNQQMVKQGVAKYLSKFLLFLTIAQQYKFYPSDLDDKMIYLYLIKFKLC
jgi:hypothetical protein